MSNDSGRHSLTRSYSSKYLDHSRFIWNDRFVMDEGGSKSLPMAAQRFLRHTCMLMNEDKRSSQNTASTMNSTRGQQSCATPISSHTNKRGSDTACRRADQAPTQPITKRPRTQATFLPETPRQRLFGNWKGTWGGRLSPRDPSSNRQMLQGNASVPQPPHHA